jgi:hypothetical protein
MASIDDAMILPHAANLDGSNFRKGNLQNVGHRLQPAGADAGSALFVFLHLLEGQAEVVAQLFLAHAWHRRIRTRFPTCLSTGLGPLVAIVISAGPYFLMSQFKYECNRSRAVWRCPQSAPKRRSTKSHHALTAQPLTHAP